MTDKKLTAKERRFVDEYPADCNATQAAIRAGYSARSARAIGAENLTKPHIQAELKLRFDALAARATRSAEDVRAELEKLAFANLKDFLRGDLGNLTAGQMAAVREMTIVQLPNGGSRVRIKLWDKRAALNDLARLLGPAKGAPAGAGKKERQVAAAIDAARDTAWSALIDDSLPAN